MPYTSAMRVQLPQKKRPAQRYVRARLTPEIFEALTVLMKEEPTGTEEVQIVTKLAHIGAAAVLRDSLDRRTA